MRKYMLLLLLILLAALPLAPTQAQGPQPGAPGVGDPYYPTWGNGGYDAQHYTLDLSVDMQQNVISGTATLEATATQDLSAFNLDFQGFEISAITVDGAPADFSRDGQELTITPAEPIANGAAFTVAVTYQGTPRPFTPQAVPIKIGWINYGEGSYVAGEPDGAPAWFPVNDHPSDKALYTFRITVDSDFIVAANGVLTDTEDHGATTTYVWEMTDPMASYLATVNIAPFVVQDQEGPNGLPIRNYFPPSLAEQAEVDFARAPDMLDYFSSVFGPYPFDSYGVVVADASLGFALETQSLVLYGDDIVTGTGGNEETIAHEMVHQWFGDSVSPAQWKDVWLNEGFATYGSWLWLEHDRGAQAFQRTVGQYYDLVSGQSADFSGMEPEQVQAALARFFPPPGNPPAEDLFNGGVYLRGGLTLHALRLQVGDDAFFNILRTYAERYGGGSASTEDFIAVAEEVSGQDLGDLFDAWLFDPVVPAFPTPAGE